MEYDVPVRPDHLYENLQAGEYVALSMDEQRVLAHSPDFDDITAKLARLGEQDFVLDKVPPKDRMLVL